MDIVIKFKWIDFVNAAKLHRRQRGWKRVAWILFLAFVLFAIAGSVFLIYVGDTTVWTVLIMELVFVVVYVGYWHLVLPRRARRELQQMAYLAEPIKIVFSENGLGSESSVGTSHIKWEQLHGWKENDRVFLVYHSDYAFTTLPKRFLNDTEIVEVRSILKDHLGEAA